MKNLNMILGVGPNHQFSFLTLSSVVLLSERHQRAVFFTQRVVLKFNWQNEMYSRSVGIFYRFQPFLLIEKHINMYLSARNNVFPWAHHITGGGGLIKLDICWTIFSM